MLVADAVHQSAQDRDQRQRDHRVAFQASQIAARDDPEDEQGFRPPEHAPRCRCRAGAEIEPHGEAALIEAGGIDLAAIARYRSVTGIRADRAPAIYLMPRASRDSR
jgi:hypothetical protein